MSDVVAIAQDSGFPWLQLRLHRHRHLPPATVRCQLGKPTGSELGILIEFRVEETRVSQRDLKT